MELYVAGEEVTDSERWEEGECVGGLNMSTGVGGEVLTLNIHTKSVRYILCVVRHMYNYRIAKTILRRIFFFSLGGGGYSK